MFQKFIINRDGVLKFGHVYLHRDMLARVSNAPTAEVYGKLMKAGEPSFSMEEVSTSVLPISTL